MLKFGLDRLLGRFRAMGRPELPPDTRLYAVGDIHGRLDLLRTLGEAIAADAARRPVGEIGEVFLGDYVDRGPDSAGVLDWLIRPPAHGGSRTCLRGNHEEVLLAFLADPSVFDRWSRFGGVETLLSYGVDLPGRATEADAAALSEALRAALPPEHLAFLRRLPALHTVGGYAFAHAGLRPGVALADQTDEDLLWIREEFLGSTADFGHLVVHGHTPVEEVDLKPNRVNIDTGAYMTHRLSCLVIEPDGLSLLQTERDRVREARLVDW